MKYCPTCKAQFGGEEVFCPHDGTRLQTQKSDKPGRLAGSSLNGVVNLEAYLRDDHLGELYRGRLLKDGAHVQARVFHRSYVDDALNEAASLLAKMDTPLPPQILSVAGLFTDRRPYFIVEELPTQNSLRSMLKSRKRLPWRDAIALGCKLARIVDWLTDQGVRPMGLSPASIFVSDDLADVRVGSWLLGHLAKDLPAIDATTPLDALPLWADYVAPELLNDPEANPKAAAVFSVGTILFEMITGSSPLPEGTTPDALLDAETYPEVPSLDDADLSGAPDALADLLRMSVSRVPGRRFQSPAAIIAALSNTLGQAPDEVAPALEPADEPVFGRSGHTGPLALPAYDAPNVRDDAAIDTVGHTEPQHDRHTMVGLPAAALTDDNRREDASTDRDVPPRVIIDDPGEGRPPITTAPYAEGAFEGEAEDELEGRTAPLNALNSRDEAPSDSDVVAEAPPTASTAPLNALSSEQGFTSSSDETPAAETSETSEPSTSADQGDTPKADESIDVPEKKTLMMTAVSVQTLSDEVNAPGAESHDNEPESEASAESLSASSGLSGEATARPSSKREKPAGPSIVVSEDLNETSDAGSTADASAKGESAKDESAQSPPADAKPAPVVVDPALTSGDDADDELPVDVRSSAAEVATSSNSAVSKEARELNIGFVSAARSTSDPDMDQGWFSDSDDAWADEALRDAQEHSQSTEKMVRVVIAVILLAALIAVVVFTQSYEPEPEAENVGARSDAEAPSVDLERLEAQFEDAMERGAWIHPRSSSALEYLVDLKRHAPERYEALRPRFVEAADAASREQEANDNWQGARDLSGFASQHAPEDQALRQRAEAVQARYVALLEAENSASETTETPRNAESVGGSAPKESTKSASNSGARPSSSTSKTSPTPRVDAEATFREGRQAYARGDFNAARQAFERTLSASPDHAGANAGLGQILFDQAQMQDAERYQRRAVQARPDNIEYRLQLGTVYFRLERFQDAIRTWEEVLNRDPGNSDAQRFIELAQRRVN